MVRVIYNTMGGEKVLELKVILNSIEELRHKLHELGIAKGLADPEVFSYEPNARRCA